MNADLFLTIAFVLYAVGITVAAGLLLARSWHDVVLDEAAENRLNGASQARPTANDALASSDPRDVRPPRLRDAA
jgi:hypothetical protein